LREPELVVEPLCAAVAQRALVDDGHEAGVRGRVGVAEPDGNDARGEEEEDGVDERLVLPDKKAELEVVVVVRVERAPPPCDGAGRASKERA
jgi:hypothetical protein